MRRIILTTVILMLAAPVVARAAPQMSDDLTVTLSPRKYRICNDRPARPAWVEEVPPREAYKALTLMELYEIRAWEAITASRDCGCNVRFPSWEASAAEYQEAYAGLSQAEHSTLRRKLIEERKQLEPAVREVCEAQDNW